MPIAAAPIIPRGIPIPALPPDPVLATNLRLAWDQIQSLQEKLLAAETTIGNLITAANTLESELVALKQACAGSGIFTR